MKGKAKCYPHIQKKDKKQREIPKLSIDYAYAEEDKNKKSEEENGMPIIVMKDTGTGIKFARAVPRKGVDPYAVDKVASDIRRLGYRKLLFKSDGGPSLVALKQAVKNALDIEIILETVLHMTTRAMVKLSAKLISGEANLRP